MPEVIPPIKAVYAHGDTVTVSIIRDLDGYAMVTGAACSEIGSTGAFQYQPVFTPPSGLTTYTAIFTNGVYTQTGELILGGYDYQASQVSAPSVAQIDAQLSGVHGAGAWSTEVAGSSVYTDTVLDSSANPIQGAQVEAYSNNDRTTLVDVRETDVNGVFVMHLNPGTYYMRAIKASRPNSEWTKVVA
jgi:hypothetical protein